MLDLYDSVADYLLEMWTPSERENYVDYYKAFNVELVDTFDSGNYTLSLWYSPEVDVYELNLGLGHNDWTDPATHTAPPSKTGVSTPDRSGISDRINKWIKLRGHLMIGTHNRRRFSQYKRMIKRAVPGVGIEDITRSVPGGGFYFLAITYDNGVSDRVEDYLTDTMD